MRAAIGDVLSRPVNHTAQSGQSAHDEASANRTPLARLPHARPAGRSECAGSKGKAAPLWLTGGKPNPRLSLFLAATLLAACTATPERTPRASVTGGGAIATLQSVNTQALACWVRSGDKAFAPYRLVPELDTQVGKPRILVVEKGKALGLPVMVIEASGTPVRLATYGRLAIGPLAPRINGDVARWASGAKAC